MIDFPNVNPLWSLHEKSLIPLGFLPECEQRGCQFRFQMVPGFGVAFEHHDCDGQMVAKVIPDADLLDVEIDVWEPIKPFFMGLHDEEPA